MTDQFRRWDSAEYLKTEEDIAEYLRACMEVGGDDPAFIAKALSTIAHVREAKLLWERACSRKNSDNANIQAARVIVDDHREQARSHKEYASPCRSCRVQRGCDLLIFKGKIKRSQPAAATASA